MNVAYGLDSLTEIDFLPAAYRQRSINRRAYAWRVVAALMVAGFFTVAALFQWNQQAQVDVELAEVEVQYSQALLKNAKFAEVAKHLQSEQKAAQLYTYLRHPWPRTQVLSAIVEPLPESVMLTEWHIGHEMLPSAAPATVLPEAKTAPTEKPDQRAADLKRLLREQSMQQDFVSLVGHAADAATLHQYLARLGNSPLFMRVDLQSLVHAATDGGPEKAVGTVNFTAKAILRHGHGQTNADNAGQSGALPFGAAPVRQGEG